MMQVRCQRCGWVFTMSRESIGLAVAEAGQNEHYLADCPKCRHGIKIRVDDLRKRLPADYVLPVPAPKPAPIHVKKEEARTKKLETTPKPETATAARPKRAPRTPAKTK